MRGQHRGEIEPLAKLSIRLSEGSNPAAMRASSRACAAAWASAAMRSCLGLARGQEAPSGLPAPSGVDGIAGDGDRLVLVELLELSQDGR